MSFRSAQSRILVHLLENVPEGEGETSGASGNGGEQYESDELDDECHGSKYYVCYY